MNFDVTAPGPRGSNDVAFTPYGAFLPACAQRLSAPFVLDAALRVTQPAPTRGCRRAPGST